MLTTFYIISALFISVSVLPLLPHQHWMFRVWEFGRIQLMIFQLFTLTLGLAFIDSKSTLFWVTIGVLAAVLIHNLVVLFPYTSLYSKKNKKSLAKHSQLISIISVNVYQFNEQYDKLIKLVLEVKPDILLTMESNQAWEDALSVIEVNYPNFKKVALENTYGIHFYTSLDVESLKVHHFISDDLPSIEACLRMDNGLPFTFFGVHPPPPSPTEEDTSKERDGELLTLGKRILEIDGPVIVLGDFNNVAWAKSSILFRKTSKLIDPRIGRGFVSTFHAKYRLLRFPIDLCFHSPHIFIQDFKTLHNIGSDHLPLFCNFYINKEENVLEEQVETLDAEEEEEVEEMIENGKEEQGDRPTVAAE
ncbi:endonuclease/exonuclease/phosphatase family protein [Formosa sp. PL04]|uniref:endonuclease/exonuclease/phosphatase family protein n=1 Tax=Formosa sp. PL04 TaxID=3081755 RepID=UPI002980BAA7|nr:endonuclease/exonuclease/phosphatase family protein [Formosa sp. PL04]MDW5290317.1 endonuclease/exonuclease/phosphatase family protein [Formosa sp. PL04]